MRVLFHSKQLNFRGVTNSIVDYAHYNQEILGNESVLIYNPQDPVGLDNGSKQAVIDALSKRFQILWYHTPEELNKIAENFDLVYEQKAGHKDDIDITSTKSVVHCVFQYYQPHGDRYAYISDWLAKTMTESDNWATLSPFVPYIVNMPPNLPGLRRIMREMLGIPDTAFVIGRHGGYETFDIEFVHQSLPRLCHEYSNLYFLLLNTRQYPGMKHERIIHMPPVFDGESKTAFIAACDAGLHARTLGETFGLGICEFLFHNKPVIAWNGGFDRNHVELLGMSDLLYTDQSNLEDKIDELIRPDFEFFDVKEIVEPYTPHKVMQKFKQVFID